MVLRQVLGAISVLMFLISGVALSSQDITGGAGRIFGRPADPEVQRQTAPSGGGPISQQSTRAKQNNDGNDRNPADAVEDALELANSARNSAPPRYRDAELAYRLAAKLNPKDPRPLIGLGNVWYDQKHYTEAAAMYKQALTMLTTATGSIVRGPSDRRRKAAPLHASLGITRLQSEDFAKAQVEFEEALSGDPENAQWHALKGYSLAKQGQTGPARKALAEALRLQPGNEDYQKLLDSLPQP